MPNNKRTYSRRSMSRMPDDCDSPSGDPQKKRKTAPLAKAGRYSGPTTIPSEEGDPGLPTKKSLLDKFRKPGAGSAFQPQNTLVNSLHGKGLEAFRASLPGHQSQGAQNLKRGNKSSIVPGYRPGTTTGVVNDFKSNTSKVFASILGHSASAKPQAGPRPASRSEVKHKYVPRKYQAGPTPVPSRDMLRRSLPAASHAAQLWEENQANSPFLRLPAEIRNQVYDYVYSGKTIFIEFDTYKKVMVTSGGVEEEELVAVNKYYRTVFGKLINPLREPPMSENVPQEQGFFNHLSQVCRQLYEETKSLPYMNRWAFDSHITMLNFICLGPKLRSYQLNAIKQLVTLEEMPDNCILNRLSGLENVWIHGRRSTSNWYGARCPTTGWFDVEEKDDRLVLVKRGG